MKTLNRYKCLTCEKVLGSKQSALHHVKTFHNADDPHKTITKIRSIVQEHGGFNLGKAVKTRKKASGHFSELRNIFNDSNFIEPFSLSKTKNSNSSLGNPLPSSSGNHPPIEPPDLVCDDVFYLKQDFNNVQGNTSSGENDSASIKISSDSTLPDDVLYSSSDFPDLSELGKSVMEFPEEELSFDFLFRGGKSHSKNIETSEAIHSKTPYVDQVSTNPTDVEALNCDARHMFRDTDASDQGQQVGKLKEGPVSTSKLFQKVKSTFKVPFKTRGHCGDPGCTGCNTEPCGLCENCLHKKEKR